jgi:surfactin synthase thioesterase subunit
VSGGSRICSGEDRDAFTRVLRKPARAEATSRVYRAFLARELPAIARGSYVTGRLTVPARLVVGRSDPVVTDASLDGFQPHADDMTIEVIDGGRFLPEEQPDAVAQRIGEMRAG